MTLLYPGGAGGGGGGLFLVGRYCCHMSLDSSGFVDLLLSRRRRISQLMEGYVRCPEYDIVTVYLNSSLYAFTLFTFSWFVSLSGVDPDGGIPFGRGGGGRGPG